jgi:hypothetical protein
MPPSVSICGEKHVEPDQTLHRRGVAGAMIAATIFLICTPPHWNIVRAGADSRNDDE